MKQFLITISAGERLTDKALANHPAILNAVKKWHTSDCRWNNKRLCRGEILKNQKISNDFSRKHFFRGITLLPNKTVTVEGRLADESKFQGDIVITDGVWQKGKTIAEVVNSLKEGDVILKGANALDLKHKQAAILIGYPKAGTIGLALPAVFGRRAKLILPIGLEKRNKRIFV